MARGSRPDTTVRVARLMEEGMADLAEHNDDGSDRMTGTLIQSYWRDRR